MKIIQKNVSRYEFPAVSNVNAAPRTAFLDGDSMLLKGLVDPGDGGQGTFIYDAGSTATDDGENILDVNGAGSGRFIRRNLNESLLTGKGYVLAGTASGVTGLAPGADGLALVADSTQDSGLGWASATGTGTYLNAQNFGVVGDGVTDDTAAIQALVDNAAVSDRHRAVFFPAGDYVVSSQITITAGVYILGEGIPSSFNTAPNLGTSFVFSGTSNLFVWEDDTSSIYGIGGIENCSIRKNSGTGGTAITVQTTTISVTLADFVLRNVAVTVTSGSWNRLIEVKRDGGTGGFHNNIVIENWICNTNADDADNAYYFEHALLYLNNFRNALSTTVPSSNGINMDECDRFFGMGLQIGGTLQATNTTNNVFEGLFYANGYVGAVDINSDALRGTANFYCRTTINSQSPNLKFVGTSTDSFRAHRSTTVGGVTGDTTEYQIVYNVEDYDAQSSFDETTGEFECKIAGKHKFHGQCTLNGVVAGQTLCQYGFIHRNSGGTIQEEAIITFNPINSETSAGLVSTYPVTMTFQLEEGDTVESRVEVHGGIKGVGVYGTGSNLTYTWFEGEYIGG